METHSRAMVLGVWEGLLICYLVESGKAASSSFEDGGKDGVAYYVNILGTGLAFGVGSRLFLDYTTSGDVEVLARGVVGMTVGVLIAEFAKHALLVYNDTPIVSDLKRKTRRRVHTRMTDEEVLEGNVHPETSRSVAPATTTRAAPSSSRTRPTVNTSTTAAGPVRVPVLSAGVTRDMLRAGRRDIGDGDHESEESLERDVNQADGQRRRLQEEREWARAKGDAARSAELDAEIRRYKALSAELEKRLQRRRSTVYSTASSKNSKTPAPRQNTLMLIDDRDTSQRPQFIQLFPDPLSEEPKSAPVDATAAPSAPEQSRVRIIPTRASSLPPAPPVKPIPDSAPAPAPVSATTPPPVPSPGPQSAPPVITIPPPDTTTATAATPRRSRSQTRRSISTRTAHPPEPDAPPQPRSRKSSGPKPGPSSAPPAESSSTPRAQGRRTHVSPSRQRRESTPSKPLPDVPPVPITSRPSTAPVQTSTSAEDAPPPPIPPKRSATPPPPRRTRIALGKRPVRDPPPPSTSKPKPVPTVSTSAPAPAPSTAAGQSEPPPLPHDPPDPTLVQRILSTAPARDRRPVPITILPRVLSVPIHDGPPPPSTEGSTAPESSDDWSRALD